MEKKRSLSFSLLLQRRFGFFSLTLSAVIVRILVWRLRCGRSFPYGFPPPHHQFHVVCGSGGHWTEEIRSEVAISRTRSKPASELFADFELVEDRARGLP